MPNDQQVKIYCDGLATCPGCTTPLTLWHQLMDGKDSQQEVTDMPTNSSSSNNSLSQPPSSLVMSNHLLYINCLTTRPGSFIYTAYLSFNILLFPLWILILYHGLQQWWRKRCTSSAVVMSHSDSFTYHVVIMELICNLGSIFTIYGINSYDSSVMFWGLPLITFTWLGETFFHILTSVERYLAVVYPITYVSLKYERGVRIRNICIGCIWLLCCVGAGLTEIVDLLVNLMFSLVVLCFIINSFCSLSVLYILICPGPGEQGANRERSVKLRAFYTIVAILGAQVARFVGGLAWGVANMSGGVNACIINVSNMWFNVPSTLVLPLLFLYREGKFLCCKNNSQ
ncbi:hypothetical protein ACER0C_001358 [Sarotherodon galilaeus]